MTSVETSQGTFTQGQRVRYGTREATIVGFGINRNGTRTLHVQFTAYGQTFTDSVLTQQVETV